MFIILISVMVSQEYTYVTTYPTAQFKDVQFIICQLYFNKAEKNEGFCSRGKMSPFHKKQINEPQ